MLLANSIETHDPTVALDVHRVDLASPTDLRCQHRAAHVTGYWNGVPVGYLIVGPSDGIFTSDELRTLFRLNQAQAITRAELEYVAFPTPWPSLAENADAATYSVAICTADRPEALRRCLASLQRLSTQCRQVIIVDNSQELSAHIREIVEDFAKNHPAGVSYIREKEPGLDRSRNRALLAADTELVLFTDDDVEISREWDSWLVDGFRDPLVMASAGLVLPASLGTPSQIRSEQFCSHARGFASMTYGAPHLFPLYAPVSRPATPGVGASLAVRRAFAVSLGGFPDELDAGMPTGTGGDTWMLRAVIARGYRIAYRPRSEVRHWHREHPADLDRLFRSNSSGVWALNWRRLDHARRPSAIKPMMNTIGWHCRTFKRVRQRDAGALPGELFKAELRGALGSARSYLKAKRLAQSRPELPVRGDAPAPWLPPVASPEASKEAPSPNSHPVEGSVSVCIPTRGRKSWVVELVSQLLKTTSAGEIIVAIDGDTDGTGRALEALSETLPRQQAKRLRWTALTPKSEKKLPGDGHGAGLVRNRAAELAHGDYLLFLDDDVELMGHDLVARHLEQHNQAEQGGHPVVVVGSAHIDLRSTLNPNEIRGRNWWVDHTRRLATEPELGFIDLCTANVSMARSTFIRLGGFPELARREDWLFGLRAKDTGVAIVGAPKAMVLQRPSSRITERFDRLHDGMGDGPILSEFQHYSRCLPADLKPAGSLLRAAAVAAGRWPHQFLRLEPLLYRSATSLPHRRIKQRVDRLRTICCYWAGVGLSDNADQIRILTSPPANFTPSVAIELADGNTDAAVSAGVPFAVHYRGNQLGVAVAYGNHTAAPIWRLRRHLIDRFSAEAANHFQYTPDTTYV